jgi:Uma2 family endonuclease
MPAATEKKLWTSEDLEAFPDDGVERFIIDGKLYEEPTGEDMSLYSPAHASALIAAGTILKNWVKSRPDPRPVVYGGDIFFKFRNDPDTDVGVDIALCSPEQTAQVTPYSRFVEGAPILAVEILSPSDRTQKVRTKTNAYLSHATPLVWVVDPFDRAVTVYRPNQPPVLFNSGMELVCEPELPGFRCRVNDLFE